jgi:hypothetical protein
MLLGIRQGTSRDWGTTGARNAGAPIAEIVNRAGLDGSVHQTLLDYGAGEGTLRAYLEASCPTLSVAEYDPGIPEKQYMPSGTFDFVVSTDVLEHVEPECIDAVLDEIFDKADLGVYHHIATCPTRHLLPDGRDYHILLKPHSWWKDKLIERARGKFVIMEHSAHWRRQRGEDKTSVRFYLERASR